MKIINNPAKAYQFINELSPELKNLVLIIADDLRPLIEEIHAQPPTTKNYYGDYLRILSHKPSHKNIIAMGLLYVGANPEGLQAAVNLL